MLKDLFSDMNAGRELAWQLFVRDNAAQFRQTMFGYVWAFLPPLVGALTFVFLRSQGLFNAGDIQIPYAAFAMIGTMLWQIFVDALQAPTREVLTAKSMLTKINFPRESIIMAGFYKVVFNALIRVALLFGVLLYFHLGFTWQMLLFPLAIAALIALGMALGMALVPIGGLYGDVQKIIPVVATFWMLLTPVVYAPRSHGVLGLLAAWNPVSPIIVTARQCFTGEHFTQLFEFATISGASVIILALGLLAFRLTMPHIIERMGG